MPIKLKCVTELSEQVWGATYVFSRRSILATSYFYAKLSTIVPRFNKKVQKH